MKKLDTMKRTIRKILLASESPYKIDNLRRSSLKFSHRPPRADEEILKKKWQHLSPEILAAKLALSKAESIEINKFESPSTLIVSSDQIPCLDGLQFSKPGTLENAVTQLKLLQNKTHTLITAWCLLLDGEILCQELSRVQLRMKALSDEKISNYLSSERPFNCAGSYKFESPNGQKLFDWVVASDPRSIQGLPTNEIFSKIQILARLTPEISL